MRPDGRLKSFILPVVNSTQSVSNMNKSIITFSNSFSKSFALNFRHLKPNCNLYPLALISVTGTNRRNCPLSTVHCPLILRPKASNLSPCHILQMAAVGRLAVLFGCLQKFCLGYPTIAIGNLFRCGNHHTLPLLHYLHKIGRFHK